MRVLRLPVFVVMTVLLAGCAGGVSQQQATGGAGSPGQAAAAGTTTPAQRGVEGLATVQSDASVEQTTNRLKRALEQQGLTVVATVDHAANAQRAGLNLPPTRLVIFGNPKLGTPLMQASRTTAIDLPQKMLVWKGDDGQVRVGYNKPSYLAERHDIEGQDQVLRKVTKALRMFAQSSAGS